MELRSILKELEMNAQVLLAPPNLVTPNQRKAAESVFLEFRKTKSPYEMCRQILETSTVDYVLFETADLIKIALMEEWNFISRDTVLPLWEYLLQYVISKPTLAPFVRERILKVIAVIAKRLTVHDSGEHCAMLLDQAESMVMSGVLQKQLLACGIMSALIQEFAITINSSDVGITWEYHIETKKKFESTDVPRIFKFCTTVLSELCNETLTERILPFVKSLLSIAEAILSWQYNSNYDTNLDTYLPTYSHDKLWQSVIDDSSVVQIYFTMYSKVRTNFTLAHNARNCLVVLSGISGVMRSNDIRVKYLTNYIQEFLKFIPNIQIIDQEALGIATIICRLVKSGRIFELLPYELLDPFTKQLIKLTQVFAEGEAQEETQCSDDNLYFDAFQLLLNTWSSILTSLTPTEKTNNKDTTDNCNSINNDSYLQLSKEVYDIYLKSKLSPPEGVRIISKQQLEKEIIDIEDSDKITYNQQLDIISDIGRNILNHTLPLLSHLIEVRTMELKQELETNCNNLYAINHHNGIPENYQNIYEDLHWLILLSRHLITVRSFGEVILIPKKVMKYSMDNIVNGKTNINVTMQLLASPHCNLPEIPGAEESADHVIRLIAAIFRLCDFIRKIIEANLIHILSPELIDTITWFLHAWSENYFMLKESKYQEISPAFIQAFGIDSEGAQWSMNFILDTYKCIFNAFKGEETLIDSINKCLLLLVSTKEKVSCVLKSDRIGYFVELVMKNEFTLPPSAKRGLMSFISRIGLLLNNKNDQQQYWSQTIESMQKKLNEIVSRTDFSQICHDEYIKVQISDILDCVVGVTGVYKRYDETFGDEIINDLYQLLHPVLIQLEKLSSVYGNYPEIMKLILELLYGCSNVVYCRLEGNSCKELCKIIVINLYAYTRYNTNRFTINYSEEDNSYQNILLVLKLLDNIIRDTMHEVSKIDSNNPCVDFSMFFLNMIAPMMTLELLKVPQLCRQCYQIILHISQNLGDIVCGLSPDLLKQLMAAIELGLYSFGEDTAKLCLDTIQVMTLFVLNEPRNVGNTIAPVLLPFINILINLSLTNQINVFDNSNHANVGEILYYLICCHRDEYEKNVQNFITVQSNPETQHRLAAAFNELTVQINFDYNMMKSSAEAIKFNKKFKSFVSIVRAFLTIK